MDEVTFRNHVARLFPDYDLPEEYVKEAFDLVQIILQDDDNIDVAVEVAVRLTVDANESGKLDEDGNIVII